MQNIGWCVKAYFHTNLACLLRRQISNNAFWHASWSEVLLVAVVVFPTNSRLLEPYKVVFAPSHVAVILILALIAAAGASHASTLMICGRTGGCLTLPALLELSMILKRHRLCQRTNSASKTVNKLTFVWNPKLANNASRITQKQSWNYRD